MREYIGSIPGDMSRMQGEVDENIELCELVESFSFRLTDEVTWDQRARGIRFTLYTSKP